MVKDPWFRPLYRRAGVLAVLAGWALFEWWASPGAVTGNIWVMIPAGLFVYAFWGFFVSDYYRTLPENGGQGDGDSGAGDARGDG